MAKKPRNYGATESTLTQLRKTRRDIAALTKRVRSLEVITLDLASAAWQQVQRPQPKGKR